MGCGRNRADGDRVAFWMGGGQGDFPRRRLGAQPKALDRQYRRCRLCRQDGALQAGREGRRSMVDFVGIVGIVERGLRTRPSSLAQSRQSRRCRLYRQDGALRAGRPEGKVEGRAGLEEGACSPATRGIGRTFPKGFSCLLFDALAHGLPANRAGRRCRCRVVRLPLRSNSEPSRRHLLPKPACFREVLPKRLDLMENHQRCSANQNQKAIRLNARIRMVQPWGEFGPLGSGVHRGVAKYVIFLRSRQSRLYRQKQSGRLGWGGPKAERTLRGSVPTIDAAGRPHPRR